MPLTSRSLTSRSLTSRSLSSRKRFTQDRSFPDRLFPDRSFIVANLVTNLVTNIIANGRIQRLRQGAAIAIVLLLLGVSGCQLLSKLPRTMPPNETKTAEITQSFHQALVDQYPNETIGVNVNHTTLDRGWTRTIDVQFINSSLNESQDTERAQRAEAVARLAEDYLLLTDPQDSISVRFLDSTTYGILTYDRVIDTYTLHTTDLAQV